jgi:DNA polymerase III alpha subunit
VRAHVDAKEADPHLLIGAEFTAQAVTPFRTVVLIANRNGYGDLSATITRLRMSSAENGAYRLDLGVSRDKARDRTQVSARYRPLLRSSC